MTQHELGNNTWVVWREALERRQDAREHAMSEAEFGPQKTETYELDSAGITGEDNPKTYQVNPYGDDKAPIDYRDVDPRFG